MSSKITGPNWLSPSTMRVPVGSAELAELVVDDADGLGAGVDEDVGAALDVEAGDELIRDVDVREVATAGRLELGGEPELDVGSAEAIADVGGAPADVVADDVWLPAPASPAAVGGAPDPQPINTTADAISNGSAARSDRMHRTIPGGVV